jgi:hypothetical protein
VVEGWYIPHRKDRGVFYFLFFYFYRGGAAFAAATQRRQPFCISFPMFFFLFFPATASPAG